MGKKTRSVSNAKLCATCEFWNGTSVEAWGSSAVEYDMHERAQCSQLRTAKPAFSSCNKHQKRYDL